MTDRRGAPGSMAAALWLCAGLAVGASAVSAENRLVNGDAESPALDPWYDALGNGFGLFRAPAGTSFTYEGERSFYAGCTGPPDSAWVNELAQDVDLSDLAADIDAGRITIRLAGWARSSRNEDGSQDLASIGLELRDAGGLVVDSFTSPPALPVSQWVSTSHSRVLPAGARRARVRLLGSRTRYSCTDALFDALSLVLERATPAAPVTWARVRDLYR